MALAMRMASVNTELGETPKQFERREPDRVESKSGGAVWMVWYGPTVTPFGTFLHGKAWQESFAFRDKHPMRKQDIGQFLKPYLEKRYWWSDAHFSNDGTQYAFDIYRPNGEAVALIV
jgi:hypothetical protein